MPRTLNSSAISLSVIVPVFNEQYLIEASLERLKVLADASSLSRVRIIVVDDASTDATPHCIERFRKTLESQPNEKLEWIFLSHEQNRGKGAAIRTALEQVDTDLVVFHDADLEYHPEDLIRMVRLFQEEAADAVFGSRFLTGEYRRVVFFRHTLGNKALTFLCNLISDLNLTDMETCYKMIRADLLKDVPLVSSDFGIEPEITIKLAKRGARIFEVPIRYSGRTYQEGKKINWKDGWLALFSIVRFAFSDHVYAMDCHGGEILGRLRRAPSLTKWMGDTIRPYVGERVLEVGAGIGNLTINLAPRTIYWATDINPHYLARLQSLSDSRPYLTVVYIDATNRDSFPSGQLFDTVVCLNVVEHLEDDITALRNIRDSLDEDGRAIILVPQGPWLYGKLDEVLGHYRRYTKEQLVSIGERAGLRAEKVVSFNRIGTLGWWFNGKILRKSTLGYWQVKILNLFLPVIRHFDKWLPFPSLSIIAIFRKESTSVEPSGAD
jgi:glycosyltransferase involved in cell wall biosynthesis